jgi:probable O-glycosylation ligase (exosortase A-associated)
MLKTRRAFFIGLFGVLVGYMTWTFMPIDYKERMLTVLDPDVAETDASAMGRINAWRAALYRVELEPITGGGFETLAWEGTDAHNILFEVLAEHGWVGLFLYLLFWVLAWRTASRVARVAKKRPDTLWMRDLVAMIQTGLIGYAVSGMFLGLAYFDLFYCYVVIIVITRLLLDRALAQQSLQTDRPIAGYPARGLAPRPAPAGTPGPDPTGGGRVPAPHPERDFWHPPLR